MTSSVGSEMIAFYKFLEELSDLLSCHRNQTWLAKLCRAPVWQATEERITRLRKQWHFFEERIHEFNVVSRVLLPWRKNRLLLGRFSSKNASCKANIQYRTSRFLVLSDDS